MKGLVVLFCVLASALTIDDNDNGGYVPDNSGQYVPTDEGRYIPDFSGQYTHDGSGNYNDDGTGKYSGSFEKYRNGFNNPFGAATNSRPVIQPVIKRKITPAPAPIPALVPREPQLSYDNYKEGKWKIIRQLSDADTNGYHYEYETENKITAEESGKVHNVGNDEVMKAKGFFRYTGPDNVVYAVEYTADENGFVPVGNHLPTPPPIPAEIAKTLK